ncbi:hypothetical protein PGT21_004785 [Puccinia graminis f. sp. tritici]|uniref:Uncharacterized protein n=1 Tax=Puccinia graminis f. sp. tritici TaxID=56615 RepID=A0A5B0LWR7_PUCGR|nr:hypothetical protein PGT21_004785 [Puccinia graminis f. sp. tritici]
MSLLLSSFIQPWRDGVYSYQDPSRHYFVQIIHTILKRLIELQIDYEPSILESKLVKRHKRSGRDSERKRELGDRLLA